MKKKKRERECVGVREREREGEGGREREREGERFENWKRGIGEKYKEDLEREMGGRGEGGETEGRCRTVSLLDQMKQQIFLQTKLYIYIYIYIIIIIIIIIKE